LTPFPHGFYNALPGPPAETLTKGHPDIRSASRRLLPFAVLSLALCAGTASGAAANFRATSQNARGATFEITPQSARFDSVKADVGVYVQVSVPGGYVSEEPGRPGLPVIMIPVGVPDGMAAKAHVASAEWVERSGLPPPLPVMKQTYIGEDPESHLPVSQERYEPDPGIYGRTDTWPRDPVTLGEGGPLGDSWMMPAVVRLVRYDPAHKRFLILKRMTLRVDFVAATSAQLKLRPGVRPGADLGAWPKVQRALLGNYESARAFPRRATIAPRAARMRLAPRRAAANPEFKISVTATGWSSVGFAALSAAGFPAGVSISQIGVWERGYDDVGDSATSTPIPVVARDGNSNGVFDAGDAITFYARKLRDRVGPQSIENRYSYANVYWLTWTGSAAVVPDSISGVIADPSPALPTSFQDTIHLEQNQRLMTWPNNTVGSPTENVEYMFWTDGSDPDQFTTSIPFVHPDALAPFRIRARYQGKEGTTHRMNVFYQSSTGTTDTLAANHDFFNRDIYLLDTGFTIPGAHIGGGTNHYLHTGFVRFNSGPTFFPGSIAFLDWVDVTYSRLYIADSNRLEFTSGSAAGVAELHVGGFTQPAIEVYDVTSPTAALRVTGTTVSLTGPGVYEVSFRTDATAGARRFVALVAGAETAFAAGAVQQDVPSDLTIPAPFPGGGFARSILIAPDAFLAPANRLADFRRGQGYVVEVASVQDIYDEFNGGIKSAIAIRRYLQHAYNAWAPRPAFVALLGDGSLDYRHDMAASAVDWVPTYMAFETIAGPNGAELVANDPRYVLNLGGGSGVASQFTPNMFLGRIPASSAAELDQFVSKVIQYENFQPNDTWRGRQFLVSDDEYSSTIFFNAGYCFQPAEIAFRLANQRMADTTAASASGSDIASDLFELQGLTDQDAVACADQANPGCRKLQCIVNALRSVGGGVDSFFNEWARGQLIFNIEAHANRYLIAHEQIYDPRDWGDLSRLANFGRPNFYMVWGCHANQFPDAPFGAGDIDSTDAIGEQWVMAPSAGSIGGLGSTGFEIIDTNAAMNDFMADAFYSTPPTPAPVPGQPHQARWIMGEVVGQAYVKNALAGSMGNFTQAAMNFTVALFGDPMTRMDALPPRVFEVTENGAPFPANGLLTIDTPGASVTIVAKVRDEAGLQKTDLAERSAATGAITPLDPSRFSVAVSDTGRGNTLTAHYRPHIDNYDLLVRSTDTNGRQQTFALEVRSTARYLANGAVIVNGGFIESNAALRAEVTTPIPVTADSLTLFLDGVPLANVTKTALDATNRRWALDAPPVDLVQALHTLDVEISGRAGVFAQGSFNVETSLAIRRVVVVSPRLMGSGCDGSVFQFELTTPSPKVQLLLMTVAGRRVASLEWPGQAGFNVYCWDGRDSQGNVTANGLYFYRLSAVDAAGHKVSQDGRMIRTR
jgi:hypothetical protein